MLLKNELKSIQQKKNSKLKSINLESEEKVRNEK